VRALEICAVILVNFANRRAVENRLAATLVTGGDRSRKNYKLKTTSRQPAEVSLQPRA